MKERRKIRLITCESFRVRPQIRSFIDDSEDFAERFESEILARELEPFSVCEKFACKNGVLNKFKTAFIDFPGLLLKFFSSLESGEQVYIACGNAAFVFPFALISMFRGASYSLVIPEKCFGSGFENRNFFLSPREFLWRWIYKYTRRIFVFNAEMREVLEKKTSGLDVRVEVLSLKSEV
jgi:hypothetical protein